MGWPFRGCVKSCSNIERSRHPRDTAIPIRRPMRRAGLASYTNVAALGRPIYAGLRRAGRRSRGRLWVAAASGLAGRGGGGAGEVSRKKNRRRRNWIMRGGPRKKDDSRYLGCGPLLSRACGACFSRLMARG
jgi:hypothetical protein